MMLNFTRDFLIKAQDSRYYLWLLNQFFRFAIPFNAPHMRISKVEPYSIEVIAPYKRRNKNHINGIHASCITAISEFASAVVFVHKLNPVRYRFIPISLTIDYIAQAKSACRARATLDNDEMIEKIIIPLQAEESVRYDLDCEVYDAENRLISHCVTSWQIKEWKKVRSSRFSSFWQLLKLQKPTVPLHEKHDVSQSDS